MPFIAVVEEFFGAGDGVSSFVEQDLELEDELHIRPSVEALFGVGPLWPYGAEFAFPIAQDMRRDISQFANLADLKIEFVWNLHIHIASRTPV